MKNGFVQLVTQSVARFRSYKKRAIDYKGGKCERCGYNRCQATLDFHHVDPNKKDPSWKRMRKISICPSRIRQMCVSVP